MSDDGTKPPSITPKKSSSSRGRASGSGGRKSGTTTKRPASGGSSAKKSPTATNGAPTRTEEVEASTLQTVAGPVSGDGAEQGSGAAPAPAVTPASVPVTGKAPTKAGQPRRVRLVVSKVDPWSVMKLSFLLSVAIGIMIVVAAAVVWFTLDGLAVFTQVNSTIAEITGDPDFFNVLEYMAFDRVISLATMIAVVDIVILTALATIGAFLYNIVAALVGGIHVTLTDD